MMAYRDVAEANADAIKALQRFYEVLWENESVVINEKDYYQGFNQKLNLEQGNPETHQ